MLLRTAAQVEHPFGAGLITIEWTDLRWTRRRPRSVALTVLSLIPPWSPLTMPSRIALGGVPVWQVVLAFVLSLAFTGAVLLLGGRIYARSVLRTGARVSLREAFGR